MPDIPTIQKTFVPEGAKYSTGPIQAAAGEIQRGNEALGRSMRGVEQLVSEKYQEYQKANDALEAVRLENNFRDKIDEIAQSFRERTDFENFDKDLQKQTDTFEGLRPKSENQNLNLAFERMKSHYGNNLNDAIQRRKYTVMSQQGEVEALKLTDRQIEDYTNATSDQERKQIVDTYKKEMDFLGKNNLINPVWVQEKVSSFEKVAKSTDLQVRYHKALNLVMATPTKDILEQAIKTFQIPDEKQAELRKQQRIEFDAQTREADHVLEESNLKIENDYFNRIYVPEYSKIHGGRPTLAEIGASTLPPARKQHYEDILSKPPKPDKEITSREDALEYNRIDALIDSGVNPKVIKDIIANSSSRMKEATRFKLIDRVDHRYNTSIESGVKKGNDYLQSQIAPTGHGALGIPTIPEEQANAQKARWALTDWVKEQNQLYMQNKRKPLTEREITDQAEGMVSTYQISYGEKLDIQKRELQNIKSKKQPTSGYEINSIYNDASGRKAKYLGKDKAGKDQWQIQP